ncbi:MAG: tetratricopeptide repeat protein [Candidatus Goldbacteria bacterium]|nr:tetratricopeptide repeat protein [Candidatus Goldiibacteriota bacterium]
MTPEEKTLYVKLAYQYYQNKDYKKAISLYEQLAEAEKDDFNILNMLGDAYLKAEMKEKAADAYINCISVLESKGQLMKIIKLCKKIIKTFPDDPRLKNKLKTTLRLLVREAEKKTLQHEYKEAREIYEEIKDFESEEFPVSVKLKELNEDEEKYKAREKHLAEQQNMAKVEPSNELLEKFEKMAQNYLDNEDYDGAVETYITALKLSPGNQDLRKKLHDVYRLIAKKAEGEQVWQNIDMSSADKIEEAKRKAAEERRMKIIQEEEERARRLLEEELKIQKEYEAKEMEIIQKAGEELKQKLEEAHKKEKLKEEEIQRIMKEQEAKKRELLEKIKKEAIEKWKKQKEAIQGKESTSESKVVETPAFLQNEIKTQKANLMDTLKKTYEIPQIGKEVNDKKDIKPTIDIHKKEEKEYKKQESNIFTNKEIKEENIVDDIGEVESKSQDDIIVNDETLDSLITTAFIYISQNVFKEAMRIYNKLVEKYPDHPEVKQIIQEISKRQGN